MAKQDRVFDSTNWIKIGIAILLILIGIAIVASVFYNKNIVYYGFFPFGWIGWIIGIFILFFIFRWIFWGWWGGGWWYSQRRQYRHHGNAYYILKERYARGEITKKEYDEKMKDLESY